MNPRILKKLTKKSEPLIIKLGLVKNLIRTVAIDGEGEETSVKVDRKHLERWGGKENKYGYFLQLDGTVGYGAVEGYYEPEWDGMDAWSILRSFVISSYERWDSFDFESDRWPKNDCPRKVKSNPAGILRDARRLIEAEIQKVNSDEY